jgi:hypothetical protein
MGGPRSKASTGMSHAILTVDIHRFASKAGDAG